MTKIAMCVIYFNNDIPLHHLPWRTREHLSTWPWIQRRYRICRLHNGSGCDWHNQFHQTGKRLIEVSLLLACKYSANGTDILSKCKDYAVELSKTSSNMLYSTIPQFSKYQYSVHIKSITVNILQKTIVHQVKNQTVS